MLDATGSSTLSADRMLDATENNTLSADRMLATKFLSFFDLNHGFGLTDDRKKKL